VFVFGYGSLLRHAGEGEPPEGIPCRLRGFRRAWNVAMDNRRTIPGYKYYESAAGGRPEVFVTFVNILREPEAVVNGLAFEVSAEVLAALDRREFSYARTDVTAWVEADLGGPAFAYLGRCAARSRFETGRRGGRAVVSRAYVDGLRAGFDAHGMLEEFDATTEAHGLPVRELRQIPVAA
jgi:cation transport regulator ChaC